MTPKFAVGDYVRMHYDDTIVKITTVNTGWEAPKYVVFFCEEGRDSYVLWDEEDFYGITPLERIL